MNKSLPFIFLFLLLFNSCTKDENNPITTKETPPDPPVLLSPADGTFSIITSPQLNWNASNTAFFYNLQVSRTDSFNTFVLDDNVGNVTSKLISNLSKDTKYYWRANATNLFGTSVWSKINSFTTGKNPTAPQQIFPQNNVMDQEIPLGFIWNSSDSASSYILRIRILKNTGESTLIYEQNVGTDTMKTVAGLNHFTKYHWDVSAVNTFGKTVSTVRYFHTKSGPCQGLSNINYMGKTYNTVQIYDQCWLKENLNVGTMIPGNQEQTNNGIIEKYCYDNNEAYCDTFGGLYQWEEVLQNATPVQGICPAGWHVATENEYRTLWNAVQYWETNSLAENGIGSNITGFSALFGGYLNSSAFTSLNSVAGFWTATENDSSSAFHAMFARTGNMISILTSSKLRGLSVRCLKD